MCIDKRIVKIFLALLLLTVVSACRTVEIASDLDQFQANKIISKLNIHGISAQAESTKGSKGKYALIVNQSDRLAAITLMDQLQLISKPDSEFSELTKSQGFLPSSRAVENLKLDRAIAAELGELLNAMPQVSSSSVIVRLNYLPAAASPAMSILLEISGELPDTEAIKKLAANSVPGILFDNIIVDFKVSRTSSAPAQLIGLKKEGNEVLPVTLVPFLIWLVPEGVDYELALVVLGLALMAIILGLVLGFAYGRSKNKKQIGTVLPDAAAAALQIDSDAGRDQDQII